MGRNRVVVATLLVHSVNTAMSKDKIKVMAPGGTACKGSICFPIHSDSPEAWGAPGGQSSGSYRLTAPPGQEGPSYFSKELSPSFTSDSLSLHTLHR